MIKKILAFLMIAIALLTAACGQGISTPNASSAEPAKTQAQVSVQSSSKPVDGFSEKELIFVLGDVEYPLNSDAAPLLDVLGPGLCRNKSPKLRVCRRR